jgi:hypothetical protein
MSDKYVTLGKHRKRHTANIDLRQIRKRAHGKSKKHGKYFSGSFPPTVKIFAVGEKKTTENLLSKNFVPEPRASPVKNSAHS